MTDFREANDPAQYLAGAPVSTQLDFVAEIRKSAGWLVGSLDQIIGFLLGFSPLEEWVAKPFAGDWNALDCARQAWGNAGKAFGCLGDNLESVAGEVPSVWTGEASEACVSQLRDAAAELKRYPGGCDSIAKLCESLTEMAQAAATAIAAALGVLVDIAVEVAGWAAVPVGGEAAILLRTPGWTIKITKTTIKAKGALTGLSNAIKAFKKVITIIKPLLDALSAFQTATSQGKSQIESTRESVAYAFA